MSGAHSARRALVSQVALLLFSSVLLVSLLLASGCSHRADAGPPPAEHPDRASGRLPVELADALDRVVAAEQGRYEMLFEVRAADVGTLASWLRGAFDRPAGRLSLTIHHEDLMQRLAEEGLPAPGNLMADRDIVVDGGTQYLRGPELAETLGVTGWVSFPGPDFDTVAAALVDHDIVVDPSAIAELLRGVSAPLRPDGEEDVHDLHTRRFTASVRLDAVLSRVAPERQDLVAHQLDALRDLAGSLDADEGGEGSEGSDGDDGGDDGDEVQAVVWLADDGSLRRFRFVLPTDPAATGVELAAVQVLLADYDGAVAIDVPPAAEVRPIDELTGGTAP